MQARVSSYIVHWFPDVVHVDFAGGSKVLFCGLPFGLSRHAPEQFIEHERGCCVQDTR